MEPNNQKPTERAREKALRLLAVRNRATREMRQRLAADGFSDQVTEAAVLRLTESGLLDDHRFALERARAMGRGKGWGPRKLRADLRQRGIPDEVAEEAIDQAYGDRTHGEVMRKLIKKRFGGEVLATGADRKVRSKAQRYLLGKGFDPEEVMEIFPPG